MQEKVLVSVRARRTKRTEIELIQLRVEEILKKPEIPSGNISITEFLNLQRARTMVRRD